VTVVAVNAVTTEPVGIELTLSNWIVSPEVIASGNTDDIVTVVGVVEATLEPAYIDAGLVKLMATMPGRMPVVLEKFNTVVFAADPELVLAVARVSVTSSTSIPTSTLVVAAKLSVTPPVGVGDVAVCVTDVVGGAIVGGTVPAGTPSVYGGSPDVSLAFVLYTGPGDDTGHDGFTPVAA
jgi:hypothetical protein